MASKPRSAADLADARDNAALIGENREKANAPKKVSTQEDVPAYVTDKLKKVITDAGLSVVDSGGDVVLTGELQKFFVEETNDYSGELRVKFTAKNASGKELWTGSVLGHASNFGRSYNENNYHETSATRLWTPPSSCSGIPVCGRPWAPNSRTPLSTEDVIRPVEPTRVRAGGAMSAAVLETSESGPGGIASVAFRRARLFGALCGDVRRAFYCEVIGRVWSLWLAPKGSKARVRRANRVTRHWNVVLTGCAVLQYSGRGSTSEERFRPAASWSCPTTRARRTSPFFPGAPEA